MVFFKIAPKIALFWSTFWMKLVAKAFQKWPNLVTQLRVPSNQRKDNEMRDVKVALSSDSDEYEF